LTAKGFGESKPMASNDTDEGKEQNRRVEFIITEQDEIKKVFEVDPKTGEKKEVNAPASKKDAKKAEKAEKKEAEAAEKADKKEAEAAEKAEKAEKKKAKAAEKAEKKKAKAAEKAEKKKAEKEAKATDDKKEEKGGAQ